MAKNKAKLQNAARQLDRALELPAGTLSGGAHIELNSNREAVIDGCNIEFKLASTVKANVKSYLEKIVAIAPEAAKAIPDSAFFGLE